MEMHLYSQCLAALCECGRKPVGKTSPRFPPSPGAAQQILYWVTATTTSHTATDIHWVHQDKNWYHQCARIWLKHVEQNKQ